MNSTTRAFALLKDRFAPRVITRHRIEDMFVDAGMTLSRSGYRRVVNELVEAGCLAKVNLRLYLNREAMPPAGPDEAACHLEAGSVISLQRVLGIHGILNNPSRHVTAVVPFHQGEPPPKLGPRHTDVGLFVFRGMPAHVLAAGDEEDRLALFRAPMPGNMPIATPEKALVDWIYLGASGRSNLPAPPMHDIDLDMLDIDRIRRLASAIGSQMALKTDDWLSKAEQVRRHDESNDDWFGESFDLVPTP